MKFLIQTFGCQMNKLDSEIIASKLAACGWKPAEDEDTADLLLFNTCSVRARAEEKVYSRLGALRKLKADRPGVLIGVIGCMAQREAAEIRRRAPHIDLVCGPLNYHELEGALEQLRKTRKVPPSAGTPSKTAASDAQAFYEDRPASPQDDIPFHSYVCVMTGCDNRCSYCVVPDARGMEISRAPQEIVDECKRLADAGITWITLLGQNVTSYGKRFAGAGEPLKARLGDLIADVAGLDSIKRISFVTSHPSKVTNELLRAIRDTPKVSRYLHVPAQSGSDRVLKLMKRGYTGARYRELLAEARETVEGIEIVSDFIVGFPTETEDDFLQTESLVRDARFHRCFIFKYSSRPGTAASKMPDDVPTAVKMDRNQRLLRIQAEISRQRNVLMVGGTVEVLVEGEGKLRNGRMTGRTNANHIVNFAAPPKTVGEFVSVRITSATALSLSGEII
jgi:tRNA-2-methylthio-N6-dimethylallyladenosine synthase